MIPVQHENQNYMLKVLVAKGKRPCLLGRDWLKKIRLNWKEFFAFKS